MNVATRLFFYAKQLQNTRVSLHRNYVLKKVVTAQKNLGSVVRKMYDRRKKLMAAQQKIRIKLKSYDHSILDMAAQKIVEIAKSTGAKVSGPVPLPTKKEIITIIRATHKYKDSREQFEIRTHKRLIDILEPSPKTVDSLIRLDLPAGIEIEIKK